MSLTHLKVISKAIDRISDWSGRVTAWIVLAMVAIVVYDVSMRYLFQIGSVALQELEWHLFALLFLFGAAYTLKDDGHVRVDILYQTKRFGPTGRAWVNIIGCLFFLLPFSILIIYSTWPFVEKSFVISEGSPDPGGLPLRFLLKAAIIVGFILLIMQSVSLLIKDVLLLMENNINKKDRVA